mgnify:FL=1
MRECRCGSGSAQLRKAVARIREAIESARAVADTDAREAHVRTAVGEAVALRVQTDLEVADLQEQLTNALAAPGEEVPYFLNQSMQLLEHAENAVSGGEPAR